MNEEEIIKFIKELDKVEKTTKDEESMYFEGGYKRIMIMLTPEKYGIFEKILKMIGDGE